MLWLLLTDPVAWTLDPLELLDTDSLNVSGSWLPGAHAHAWSSVCQGLLHSLQDFKGCVRLLSDHIAFTASHLGFAVFHLISLPSTQ